MARRAAVTGTALLFGATGTIGRAAAEELVARGREVICPVRRLPETPVAGADYRLAELSSARPALEGVRAGAAISCLASRSGAPADAWAVDHRANGMALAAAKAAGAGHFVLLSAICVQKPLLAFQHAKLAFEAELQNAGIDWTIVRPTAFFKSLSGQVARVQAGRPFLVFGDGKLTACKPISDRDLAGVLADCVDDRAQRGRVLPVGGPGPAITPMDQVAMLSSVLGREVAVRRVPVAMMDAIIVGLRVAGLVSKTAREKAELARIGRYYATESMLAWDAARGVYDAGATPEYGSDRLEDFYAALVRGEASVDLGQHAVFGAGEANGQARRGRA